MAVTQGKLAMGFTTGITTRDPDYPGADGAECHLRWGSDQQALPECARASVALLLCLLHGVRREGHSGGVHRHRNRQLPAGQGGNPAQAKSCQQGQITPQELSDAQKALCSSLETISDSPGRMEDYAMFCLLSGFSLEPEAYKRAVLSLTVEDISRVARSVRLDTIFFLKGESA